MISEDILFEVIGKILILRMKRFQKFLGKRFVKRFVDITVIAYPVNDSKRGGIRSPCGLRSGGIAVDPAFNYFSGFIDILFFAGILPCFYK